MEKEKIKFITYLQIIGIVLVVIYHSFALMPEQDHPWIFALVKSSISFRMPVFIFVSGFLMILTTKILTDNHRGAWPFVKSKLMRLGLPFIVLSTVTFVPRALMSAMANDEIQLTWHSFIDSFLWFDSLALPLLWFLQVSMVLLITGYLALVICRKMHISTVKAIWALFIFYLVLNLMPFELTTFFSLKYVKRFGVFFFAGALYCVYFDKVEKRVPWNSIPLFLSLLVIWAGVYYIYYTLFLKLLASMIGIAMCLSLTHIMEARRIIVLDHLMGANYIIFLLSWYFNTASQQVLSHLVALPWYCYTVLSIVTGIYLPWLFYRFLVKYQHLRFSKTAALLLGQNIKR